MQHVVTASEGGVVRAVLTEAGATLMEGEPILAIEPAEGAEAEALSEEDVDLDHIRADLQELRDRIAAGMDGNRPDAVRKRRERGHQTARENLGQLCDPGTFTEYGGIAPAAQRHRRSLEDLIANTTGDGIVTGIGSVNGDLFAPEQARCAFAVYDYMVLAGDAGPQQPQEAGPAVRPRGRVGAAGDPAGGGRRRAARRLPRRRRRRAGEHHLLQLRAPVGAGAAGRRRLRPLLRGQRGAAGLLRRHHRGRERQYRHGGAGDDRGRRPRGVSRPRRSARSTCSRRTAWWTSA